jgi:tetratricopeptide (TPR) repeat protein
MGALWLGSDWTSGEVQSAAPERRTRVVLALAVLAIGAMVFGCVVPMFRAETLRQMARQRVDKLAIDRLPPRETVIVEAVQLARRATQQSASNADAWADLSYFTSLLAQFDPSRSAEFGIEAERAADRALSGSSGVADFCVRNAVALDMQGRWIEAGAALIRGLQLAPTRAQLWYQQAAHLGLRPAEKERALAAVAVSLRLDPGNAEAHALQRRLADRIGAL